MNKQTAVMQWHPIKKRPMDDEEIKEWSERLDCDVDEGAYIYSNLPDDGEEVLVCYSWGGVRIDTFYDGYEGAYFEENGDMDGIVAWMPLPKPYVMERSEE